MTGFIFLTTVALILTLMLCMRTPGASVPLCAAFITRFSLLGIHHNIFRLLPGRGDAHGFYKYAVVVSEDGFFGALEHFEAGSSAFSVLVGAVMTVLGTERIVPQLININLGLVCVYCTYLLAVRCGASKRDAKIGALVVALSPSIAQYSVVALREMVIVTPFMFALLALTKGRTPYQTSALVVFSLFVVVASLFHGAMIVAIFGIGVALLMFQPILTSGRERVSTLRLAAMLVMFVGLAGGAGTLIGSGAIDKIGKIVDGGIVAEVSIITSLAARGGGAYLTESKIDGYGDIALSAPLRLFYFFFSPTPWMIRSPAHFLGFLDVLVYAWATVLLWRGYKRRIFNQKIIVVIGVVGTLAFVYAFGTSNAGTAIRHRAKFGYALVAVACASRSLSRQARARDRHARHVAAIHGRHISVESR